MKILKLIILSTLLLNLSCSDYNNKKKTETKIESSKIKISAIDQTFIDIDSINQYKFHSISKYNQTNEILKWEIKIYEKNKLVETVKDSLKSMSYLVKATDLNNDGIAELIYVTAKYKRFESNKESLTCEIYCYLKIKDKWVKKQVPALTDKQLLYYSGNEIVSIKDHNIIREFPIFINNVFTNKHKKIIYTIDMNNNFKVLSN